MIVGILEEIKTEEHHVSLIPAGVEVMKQNGHAVIVEKKPTTHNDPIYIVDGDVHYCVANMLGGIAKNRRLL